MIDKEYLLELQLDAYEILGSVYSVDQKVSPDILHDYPFDMSFEDLLEELDDILQEEEEQIWQKINDKFGREFLGKYINFINDAYFRMNNKVSYR